MIQKSARSIDSFFFHPESPRAIALFRIFYSLILLQLTLIHLAPDLGSWYGSRAIVPASVAQTHYHRLFPHINLLLLFPNNDDAMVALFYVFVTAIFCLLFGLAARFSSLIIFVCLLTFQNQNPYNCNSADALLRLTAFFMMFSRCADAYSLSRVLQVLRGPGDASRLAHTDSSPWAQRLLQLQLSLVYTHATISKASSLDWQSGNAVYFAGRYEEMKRFHIPLVLDIPALWKFLNWSTIVVEGSLAWLVWVPFLTRWILLAGVALHAGIETSMNIPMFQWIMISYYVLFLPSKDVDWVLSFIQKSWVWTLRQTPVIMPYNDTEIVQARFACLVKTFDLLKLVTLGDLNDMKVRELAGVSRQPHGGVRLERLTLISKGQVVSGFSAWKLLVVKLPVLWLAIPFVHGPLNVFMRAPFAAIDRALHAPSARLSSTSSVAPQRKDDKFNFVEAVCTCVVVLASVSSAFYSNHPQAKEVSRASLIAARETFARNELKRTLPINGTLQTGTQLAPAQQLAQDTNLENSSYHSLSELRLMLDRQGSKHEAQQLVQFLKEIHGNEPGANEQRWKAVSRLADVYWQDNRLDDAVTLLGYVWEKRATQFKSTLREDPELLATVLAIAAIKRDAGDYAGAEQFFSMAVRYKQRINGADHRETLVEQGNLALVQYLHGQSLIDSKKRTEKWKQSCDLFEQVIASVRRQYPQEHDWLRHLEANAALAKRDSSN